MRVIHVVPKIDEEASGPSYSVPRLCEALAHHGAEVELHNLGGRPRACDFTTVVHREWPWLRNLGISPQMFVALSREATRSQIIHNHSLWMLPNVYPGHAVRGRQARLVTSPRGTLSAWALNRSRWKKKIFWQALQKEVVLKADCLHVTSEQELLEVRAVGARSPVAVIPNGIDIPETPAGVHRTHQERTLLFLARIHPVKGVELLLQAWSKLERAFPGWRLNIVGPLNDAYGSSLQRATHAQGLKRVFFSGALYGEEKREAYRQADLFVLPSYSENFGVSIAEALSFSLPVVVSKGAPWAGVVAKGCGWWHEINEEALAEALRDALSRPDEELLSMGQKGRQWMIDEFSWERLGAMMLHTYEWLVGGGVTPGWIVR